MAARRQHRNHIELMNQNDVVKEIKDMEQKIRCLSLCCVVFIVSFCFLFVAFGINEYLQMQAIAAIPRYLEDGTQTKVLHLEYENSTKPSVGQGYFNWKSKETVDFASYDDGIITIRTDGTYLIYVQISFDTLSGKLSFLVELDEKEFLTCTWAESGIQEPWSYSCHSSRAAYLKAGQKLSIAGAYPELIIDPVSTLTFFGIVQIQ